MNQPFAKEKLLVLINPISGTRQQTNFPEMIEELIDKKLFEVEIAITKYKGEATTIVGNKLLDNFRYFVAVGGDGTVNEIAKALINTPAVMGIIPTGSGNGLARHLKIPLRPEAAIHVINRHKHQAIDYGLVNTTPFFCACGVGFDARVSETFAQGKERGFLNYIKTTISEYLNYKPETYQLTIDNERKIKRHAFMITFANASQYGNNASIAPKADIGDGKLDICILAPFRIYQAIGLGIRLFSNSIDQSPLMHNEKARTVLVERSAEGLVHFDGEPCRMGKRLAISLINQGLNVLIP